MKISNELLHRAGILPKLRLGVKQPKGGVKPTGSHRVKILEDKIVRKNDPTAGKEVEYVRYIVEENGEKKQYDTKLKDKNGELSYLVQRLAEIKEGEEVILEMKKQGMKNYVEVSAISDGESVEVDEDEHEGEGIVEIDDETADKKFNEM
ncbi:MAG: hypothetical protein AAB706_01450 [Patescibacteria group bacterium]